MSQQQKSPHEEFIMTTIVLGLLFAICWFIWHFFQNQLKEVFRYVRMGEMWLAAEIAGEDFKMTVPKVPQEQTLEAWRNYMPRASVQNLDYPSMRAVTYVALTPLKHVFAGVMGFLALFMIFYGPGSKYKRRMNLDRLMEEQVKSFPTIAPVLKFNPLKANARVIGNPVPVKLPLFAEALSPEEWVAFHQIKVQGGRIQDLQRAWDALAKQLGGRWQGPLKLPLHAQGIYAACALRHVRKRKESEELLNQLALSWTAEKGFRPGAGLLLKIRKIVKDPKIGGALQKYADQHAFETTALLRCLQRARQEGGVLASASFLWLRGQDRTLWYPLNNLGRKAYHPEAAGALVHFTNELIANQKIPSPRFEEVIRGLENYLKSSWARPIPPLETKSKKEDAA